MQKIKFEDFITCFRKQFIFQRGRSGRRNCKYYPINTPGLSNNKWIIYVFIHTGKKFGFSDQELQSELHLKKEFYNYMKRESSKILQPTYDDKVLQKKVIIKIGLVENCTSHTYHVKV
jgi:hypothetical protein